MLGFFSIYFWAFSFMIDFNSAPTKPNSNIARLVNTNLKWGLQSTKDLSLSTLYRWTLQWNIIRRIFLTRTQWLAPIKVHNPHSFTVLSLLSYYAWVTSFAKRKPYLNKVSDYFKTISVSRNVLSQSILTDSLKFALVSFGPKGLFFPKQANEAL